MEIWAENFVIFLRSMSKWSISIEKLCSILLFKIKMHIKLSCATTPPYPLEYQMKITDDAKSW